MIGTSNESDSLCSYCNGLENLSLFIWTSLLAGIFIGVGAELQMILLKYDFSPYLAATFFSIGLCLVRVFGVPLYTGKVGTFWEEYEIADKFKALLVLLQMLMCNLFGATLVGILHSSWSLTRKLPSFDGWSVILPAMLCGALVHIGTRSHRSYIATILCVVCFIIAGGEHCIADMFHVVRAGFPSGWWMWIGKIALGNALGAWLVWMLDDLE